jgi:hypothetical protein
MHSEAIGFAKSPMVALSYLLVAAWLLLVTRAQQTPATTQQHEDAHDEADGVPVAIASQH